MIAGEVTMQDSSELTTTENHSPAVLDGDTVRMHDNNEITDHDDEVERIEFEPAEFVTQKIRDAMIARIAASDAYFKHQQITDPDLTFQEKFSIASDLLDKNISVFLSRYGKYLVPNDLVFLNRYRGVYEIDFHLDDISRRFGSAGLDKKKVKNRRFEAMKRLSLAGEYFSDEEMKKRDPLLFEEMIGRYQTEEDVADAVQKADLSLSEVLLCHLQAVQNNEVYEQQHNRMAASEEVDSDDDDEDDDDDDEEDDDDDCKKESGKNDKEKLALRNEFVEIMQQRFLSGEDLEFNYHEIDNNEDFDSMEIVDRDEEDRYFADSPDGDLRDDNDDDYRS